MLDTLVPPYTILRKAGVKIGIFGLGVKLKGLVDYRMYKETRYLDPVEITQDITKTLKESTTVIWLFVFLI